MQLLVIVGMLIAACGVVFALQNNVPVTLTFLLWRLDGSLAMVLLGAFGIGGLIVALVSTPSTLRRQWTIARQGRRIAELEKAGGDASEFGADPQPRLPGDSGAPG